MPHAESSPTHRTPPRPLRLRRLTLGLRQADVAELAGVSREQVVRLEAGACSPTWATVQRLAAVLAADPVALFPPDEKRPAGEPGASTTLAGGAASGARPA